MEVGEVAVVAKGEEVKVMAVVDLAGEVQE